MAMTKKNDLDSKYWLSRYENSQTGWDLGYVSTPIKNYINQLTNKNIKILIPGCGNSYEAEYLFNNGFKNIYVIDIAQLPLNNLKKRVPKLPLNRLILGDFFELDDTFDLIIEQTFFCALSLGLRSSYVEKMFQLLKPKAKLIGLLFNFELTATGPPFGGREEMYKNYFQKRFNLKVLEPCFNSIPERKDKELFFIFEKK